MQKRFDFSDVDKGKSIVVKYFDTPPPSIHKNKITFHVHTLRILVGEFGLVNLYNLIMIYQTINYQTFFCNNVKISL